MLMVIETREDLAPIPADPTPRSTERALQAMGWPFPVDDSRPQPRHPLPLQAKANNVVPMPTPVPSAPLPAARPEPRRVARIAVPLFALAEAR
jgi:hypothetical protein